MHTATDHGEFLTTEIVFPPSGGYLYKAPRLLKIYPSSISQVMQSLIVTIML